MKLIIACTLTITMLSACGTVAGLGKDITSGAEWTKKKIGGSD